MLRELQFRFMEPPIQRRERVVEDVGRGRHASGHQEPNDDESDPQTSPGGQHMIYASESMQGLLVRVRGRGKGAVTHGRESRAVGGEEV